MTTGMMELTEQDKKQLNDFESLLSFKITWPIKKYLNCDHKLIALLTGNQALKTSSTAYQYVLRILGLHPVVKKNVVYLECGGGHFWTHYTKPKDGICPHCKVPIKIHMRGCRKFRFASETLPGESGGEKSSPEKFTQDDIEVKNTQYPEFKKWLPPFLIKKDITFRNMAMVLRDIFGGPDIVVEFVSYNQSVQQGAGVQRLSVWCDEEPPKSFYEEQLPRLLAEDGDLIITLTPANHICFDEKTELVTKRGWKRYNEILMSDEVLSYNLDKDCYEWSAIDGFYMNRVSDEYLFSMECADFDALVTPGHRWVAMNDRHLNKKFLKSVEALNSKERIKRLSMFLQDQDNPEWEDEFIALVGWAVTDGTFHKTHRRITIYQSETAYPENCLRIRKLLSRFEGCWCENKHEYNNRIIDGKEWSGYGVSCHFGITGNLALRMRSVTNGKTINQDFICSLSKRQLDVLFNAMIDGDGTRKKNGAFTFSQVDNQKLIDDLQLICTLLGKKTTFYDQKDYFERRGKTRTIIYVHCNSQRYSSDTHVKSLGIKKQLYSGIIWCPSTKNRTVVMRRNGKVSISGNTWVYDEIFEKAAIYYRTETIQKFTGLPAITRTDSPLSIAVIQAATDDNPTLLPVVIESMFAHYDDPDVVAIRRYGIFKQVSGRIFKDFDFSIHYIDMAKYYLEQIPQDWVHGRFVDYHERVPWAISWMAISPQDEVFVYHEMNPSPEKLQTLDITREMALASKDYKFRLNLMDPLACKTQSNTGVSVLDDFNRLFFEYRREGICTGGYWESWDSKSTRGRDEIRKRLKNARLVGKPFNNETMKDGQKIYLPTLWISNRCKQTAQSLKQWRMDEWATDSARSTKDQKDTPQQKWSHFCTAMEAAFKDMRFRKPSGSVFRPQPAPEYFQGRRR